MPGQYTEKSFETTIEKFLVNKAGYGKAKPIAFSRERGFDPGILLNFIRLTQPDEWQYLEKLLKNEPLSRKGWVLEAW